MEFRESRNWLCTGIITCFYLLSFNFCWSLNSEGVALLRFKENLVSDPFGALWNWRDEVGVDSPCSWFGIQCSEEGHVVSLNLRDLCLRSTLPPDTGALVHIKSIILRNNSFYGVIPDEIASLKELEVLDLGNNNFSGQIPFQLGNNSSITILLLDKNELLGSKSPEIYKLQKLSEIRLEEDLLSETAWSSSCNEIVNSWNPRETRDVALRKLLQEPSPAIKTSTKFFHIYRSPASPPSTTPVEVPSSVPLAIAPLPSLRSPTVPTSPPSVPTGANETRTSLESLWRKHRHILILSVAIGGPLLLLLIIGIVFWKCGKVSTVKPWATGLSGQLQKAFVTGVPKLKRSELEAACEDFSNVIGSMPFCSLYKGTLSNGTEIAVASIAVESAKNWSNNLEAEFRKKISTLSKVNHKNFSNLVGYCVDEAPVFTRMMVFEYAPNGTLFEHLHIREAEHLNWATRLRIAMGIAYCLEHMHQFPPPLLHRNLNSSAIYLTEDYAAKVSDFTFSPESEAETNMKSNVYSFGVVLIEMITGRLPYSAGSDSVDDWASDYLSTVQPLREAVDPTLETCNEDQLKQIAGVARMCTDRDPRQRPTMREVCEMLREITGIEPDGAVPKLSPLWWAELEIQSTDGS